MKRWIAVLSVIPLFLVACQADDAEEIDDTPATEIEGEDNTEDEPEETTDPQEPELSQDLESWIPKIESVVLEYEGGSFEDAGFTRTPQFALEDTYQFVNSSTATPVANIYEYREDSVVSIFSRMETYFRENFVDTGYPSETDEETILLQLLIEVGNTWESDDGAVYEITDSHVPIETESAGTFEALEVTSTSDDGERISRSYYAEDIGLVQQKSNIDDDELEPSISTLVSIHEDEPEHIPTSFYTLNSDETGLVEQEAEISLNTNDPARIAIAEALQGNHETTEGSALFDDSVEINYMFLDENDVANVDFSEEITTEMQYNSSAESLTLQAITNTIGAYYRHPVEDILITVEGEPYASEQIAYEEDQTIEVNDSMVR